MQIKLDKNYMIFNIIHLQVFQKSFNIITNFYITN